MLCFLMAGLFPGALAQLSCPDGPRCAAPVCPNTVVNYTCSVSVPRLFTRWTVPIQSCEGTNRTLLLLRQSTQSNCGSQSISCGLFQASNVPPAGDIPCTVSVLHVTVTQELNGSLITCNSSDLTAQYFIGSATLLVLSAPHISITAELNGLEVKCVSGDQDTHCNVTIQMNGAVKSIAGNTTFNGLTSNMMYPISARAINRCGDYSEISTSHWTLPVAPPTSTIRVFLSLINESATQLDISWSHIGGNVSHYKVKSISGMNIFTSQVSVQSYCVDLRCAYHQIVQTTGSHYTTTISSVNDGGEGPEGDPVQAQSKSSSSPSLSVGIGIGIPLVVCISATLLFVTYFMKKQSRHSYNIRTEYHRHEQTELDDSSTLHVPIKRKLQYIKTTHNGTVLTIQNGALVFTTLNSIPDDTQLWYIDDQPDNSFIIASKMNRMVLACIESEIVIQARLGDDSQKWLEDGNTIVSSKFQTVMCVMDPGNVPAVCVKDTSEHGIHLCCLQASLMVPMCLVDEKNGCVLEISDDKVIDTPNMDVTNLSQHWYINSDSKRDNTFTIVSRNEQKVLQLDDNGELIVKGSGFEEEAAQWTMDNGSIVVRHKRNKRYNVYPMFRNYFIIRFQSYYLTWDFNTKQVVLQDNVNKVMPFRRHLWMLDLQPDGTFTITSCVNKKRFLSIKDDTIICSGYDDCQMWRREGKFIKSGKTDSYLGLYFPASDEFIDIVKPPIIDGVGDHCVAISEHECATVNNLNPSLTISGGATGDQKQLKCECAVTKVVIQVSQILHQNTEFVMSATNNSEVFMSPRNSLPHITQFWVLDYRMDGTFLIISDTKEKLVLSCDSFTSSSESQLIMKQFSGDESQLWRFDGDHIESVKFKDQVISLVPCSQTSLCLSTKSTTDKAQLFRQESHTPVLIKHLIDNTVLELDDTSVLKFCVVDKSYPDSQVWYLKYMNGFSDSSFMIISKKNGMALEEVEGWNVKARDLDATNRNQQWKWDGLFIKSQIGLCIATDEDHMLFLQEMDNPLKLHFFDVLHFVVESYF